MTALALDPITHDFTVAGGAFGEHSGEEEIRQNVKIRLLLFQGESPWDTGAGLPYHAEIMAKGVAPARLEFLYRAAIVGTDGVTALTEGPTFTLDDATRTLSVDFRAATDVGELDFSVNVETA